MDEEELAGEPPPPPFDDDAAMLLPRQRLWLEWYRRGRYGGEDAERKGIGRGWTGRHTRRTHKQDTRHCDERGFLFHHLQPAHSRFHSLFHATKKCWKPAQKR